MEVLIVDDDTLIHEVLGAVVRRAFPGWDIAYVTDLESAFARVAHHGAEHLVDQRVIVDDQYFHPSLSGGAPTRTGTRPPKPPR